MEFNVPLTKHVGATIPFFVLYDKLTVKKAKTVPTPIGAGVQHRKFVGEIVGV